MQLRWESSKVDSWAVDVDEDWDHVHLSQIPVLRGFSGGWNHKDIQNTLTSVFLNMHKYA